MDFALMFPDWLIAFVITHISNPHGHLKSSFHMVTLLIGVNQLKLHCSAALPPLTDRKVTKPILFPLGLLDSENEGWMTSYWSSLILFGTYGVYFPRNTDSFRKHNWAVMTSSRQNQGQFLLDSTQIWGTSQKMFLLF